MNLNDSLNLTLEDYQRVYEERHGFNNRFNKNHPSYEAPENYTTFLERGCTLLLRNHQEIVDSIIKERER